MDDAIGMRGLHGPRQHFDKLCRQTRRLRRAIEVLGQAAAGHVLQDKIRPARNLADIVNLDDIGMLQPRDDIGLGAKAGQLLLAGVRPISEHLQRHDALQRKLPGLEDDAHAASPQDSDDFVAWHGRPFRIDRRRGREFALGRINRRSIRPDRTAIDANERRTSFNRRTISSSASLLAGDARRAATSRRLRFRSGERASAWHEAHASTCSCKGVSFGRAQRIGQQAGELLVGGAKRHKSVSKSVRTGSAQLPSALHDVSKLPVDMQ